jgi:hypothetical protein
MGKITRLGLVPQDDPMFLTGPELFSRPGSKPSSTTSASGTGGVTPAASTSTKLPPPPQRADFKSQAAFEEAQGYWQGHVGRIRGMAAHAATARLQTELPPGEEAG